MRRNKLTTAMEILAALREGPLNRSRLAQRCNINYGRLDEELRPIEGIGWVSMKTTSGQDIYSLTQEGLQTYQGYEALWNAYQRGLKLTSGQEGF
jgi:predicted transcriptional regulator